MANSLVSVVIPCYNHEHYIEQAISSVLSQDYPSIELIVIDDGSTDNSPKIIKELHDKQQNFTYLSQKNSGLIATLKRGLTRAKGEFFCQLASDDFLPSNSISKRVEKLNANLNSVAVFTDAYSVNGDVVTERRITRDKLKRMYASDDPITHILQGAPPIFSTGLHRTNALRAIDAFDSTTFRYYEDLDTPILLLTQGSFEYLDEALFFRRTHATNISGTTSHIRSEKIKCYQKLLAHSELAAYHKLLLRLLKRSYLQLGRTISQANNDMPVERNLLNTGWKYAFSDMRLCYYLLSNKLQK